MIDKLEYLLALATERHFGRAAQRIGVTQPTLSAGIRQLEERLGVTLVNRGARFKSLTPEGEQVLGWARRILDDVRNLESDLERARSRTGGRLRIAAIPTVLAWLPTLTVPFLAAHEGVSFEIVSHTAGDVLEAVRNFDADIGVTYLTNEAVVGFAHRRLFDERYCLLTGAVSGPLCRHHSVTWEEIAAVPLCLLDPSMQNRQILDETFAAAGTTIRPVLESNSMIALLTHVRSGAMATVLPAGMLEALGLGDAFRTIEIAGQTSERTVGLVAGPREPRPLLAAAFFDFSTGQAAR